MYYLGIDVDKHDSYIAVLDDDAEIVIKVRVYSGLQNFEWLLSERLMASVTEG